jgi:hypothetical protein
VYSGIGTDRCASLSDPEIRTPSLRKLIAHIRVAAKFPVPLAQPQQVTLS